VWRHRTIRYTSLPRVPQTLLASVRTHLRHRWKPRVLQSRILRRYVINLSVDRGFVHHVNHLSTSLVAQRGLQSLCDSFPNVLFMQKKSIVIKNTWRIVGTTLWSHVPEHHVAEVSQSLNDYQVVYIKPPQSPSTSQQQQQVRKLLVSDTEAFFQDEIRYIIEQIELVSASLSSINHIIYHHYHRHRPSSLIYSTKGQKRRSESRGSDSPCSTTEGHIRPSIRWFQHQLCVLY